MNAKSKTHYIGDEIILIKKPNFKAYKALTNDCYRFVNGKKSCLQIMVWKNWNGLKLSYHVANVYTIENERRKGHAKKLFIEAKKVLNTSKIFHSSNLSGDGKIFAKKVN